MSEQQGATERPWSEIIPETERKQFEIDEESEKLKILCVDTSRRNKKNQPATAKSTISKAKKPSSDEEFASHASDDSQNDNSSDGDDHPRKKGSRRTGAHEHSFKGMNAQEIRRFVRSYRKFPCPLNKIDVIAQDAHLEDKSQACLVDFAKKMASACQAALNEYEASGKTDDDPNGTIVLLYF